MYIVFTIAFVTSSHINPNITLEAKVQRPILLGMNKGGYLCSSLLFKTGIKRPCNDMPNCYIEYKLNIRICEKLNAQNDVRYVFKAPLL